MEEKELLDRYDEVCGICYTNLWSLATRYGVIEFRGFNKYNNEHKFMLHMAVSVSVSTGAPITIDCNFFERLKIYFKWRKNIRWIKKCKTLGYTIDELLDYMRGVAEIRTGEKHVFTNIYRTYFHTKK